MQNYSRGTRKTGSLRLALVAGIALMVAGCTLFNGAAESRARDFVRFLIISAPDDQARLTSLAVMAPGQSADALLQGVGVQVALSFLRAKHRQGRRLDFSIISTTRQADQSKIVIVAVDQRGGPLQLHRALFRLRLQESAERGWLVTGVQAGD